MQGNIFVCILQNFINVFSYGYGDFEDAINIDMGYPAEEYNVSVF